jgi:outer membrane lipopolysaccharide assembly protein LptE/RlpB
MKPWPGLVPPRCGWLLSLIPLLLSCGFQLRGHDAPMLAGHVLALQCSSEQHWHLCQTLRRELALSGVKLADTAPLTLTVDHGRTEQRTIALTIDADAAEYLVTLSVDVSLNQPAAETDSLQTSLSASHTVRSRDTAAMKQSAELRTIQTAIQTQLARDILHWLGLQLATRTPHTASP